MSTLDSLLANIVPYPKSEEEATAHAMGAHLTALAQMHGRIALTHSTPDGRGRALRDLGDFYALAFFLRRLVEHAGTDIADRVAGELWREWEDGAHIGCDLAEWLTGYGVNPATVTAQADHYVKTSAAAQAGTETAA